MPNNENAYLFLYTPLSGNTDDNREMDENGEGSGKDDSGLTMYDLKTIASATDNFSGKNKLGEGGFGPVYKVT